MFETAELSLEMPKEEYKARLPALRTELLRVQRMLRSASFPVIVVFAGVEGAGKGETLEVLYKWFDPRYLAAHTFDLPSDEERQRPPFWRFWRLLPPRGRMGIFFGSWYTGPLLQRFANEIDDTDLATALQRVRQFEDDLVADGALLLKYWFHLSKSAQKKRVKELRRDPDTRWRVRPIDRKLVKNYEFYRQIAERTLQLTSSGEAPWTIVDGSDPRYRHFTVGEHLAGALARRLDAPVPASPPPSAPIVAANSEPGTSLLNRLDLSLKLDKEEYNEELEKYQGRLHELTREASGKGMSSVLVLEGWDAAGKGGLIRRLVGGMDARDFSIVPVAAPTDEERAHHYLWRFWRHLPRAGRVTIFDRSWYGRVLVERVEGFAQEHEWRRAYREITDFEEQLAEHGMLLLKLWLHIDPDEQLRRFHEREQTPFKQFKIGEEDYRNRARWADYDLAVNEMIERTSTEFAPWALVEANDKRYARIKVLKLFCDKLEERL